MKLAFVFPGQGSQTLGMLDGFAANRAVAQLLERVDAADGGALTRLIRTGPADQLALTVNTQPAMLLTGYAAARAWLDAGGAPALAMAGHSLGEYTALTVAGAFELESALELVRARALAMQQAVPVGVGAMAAILGLDDDQVRAVCAQASQGQVLEPANFNAPSQVVIAGHSEAVARGCELAKARGAKRALALPVSAPFHCSLLASAAQPLALALAAAGLRRPTVPVVNNIDVAIEQEPARIVDALLRQASGPVQWVQVVKRLAETGATHFIEFGPGRVLSGLIKRIVPQAAVSAVFDQPSLEAALAEVNR